MTICKRGVVRQKFRLVGILGLLAGVWQIPMPLFAISGVQLSSISNNQVNAAAEYQIRFRPQQTVDVGGSVSIRFPANTRFESVTAGDIFVDGIPLAGAPVIAGNRIDFQTPVQLSSGMTVNVLIANAVMRNPSVPGSDYQFEVQTALEPGWVFSNVYPIQALGSSIAVDSVTPGLAVSGTPSSYAVQITLGSQGGLWGQHSTISLQFPWNTDITDDALVGVTVNGVPAYKANGYSATRRIDITPNQDLNEMMTVVLFIPASAVTNPTSTGTFYLNAWTDAQPSPNSSPGYFIGDPFSNVQMSSYSNSTVNAPVDCTVYFQLGVNALEPGNTVSILFPANTRFASIAASNVWINGSHPAVTPVVSGGQVTITVPVNISAYSGVSIQFSNTVMRNPSVPDNAYQLQVQTSDEPIWRSSNTYGIYSSSYQLTVNSVSPALLVAGTPSAYTIQLALGNEGSLWGQHSMITLEFPSNTAITAGVLSGITVNGTAAFSATGNSASRRIVIIPNQDLNQPATVNLFIPASAITNPTSTGTYYLSAWTDAQPNPNWSPGYTLGDPFSNVQLNACSNYTVNAPVDYGIYFQLGVYALETGNTVSILFPANTRFASISTNNVWINGSHPTVTPVVSGGQVTITVPATINAYTGVNIQFSNTVMRNPSVPNSAYTLQVQTSDEPSWKTSVNSYGIYSSSYSIAINSVTTTPNTNGQPSAYTVQLTLGTEGSLWGQHSVITLDFQNDTPSPMAC